MVALSLFLAGLIAACGAASILLMQQYRITRGLIVVDSGYNGPAQVSATLHVIIRYALKRSVHFRKFVLQYVIHLFVILLRYMDMWSSRLYAKSRNWFVRNAVRNRGTVPHFWEHLKVYKQEMDREKTD